MPKTPTVYDVADLAGVSIATVSRVFRKPHEVSQATKDRVQAAVLDLGYVPSGSARSLAARRAGAIGLCFPDFDGIDGGPAPIAYAHGPVVAQLDPPEDVEPTGDLYISEVMLGTEIEAWRHGMAVTIAVARGERGSEIFDNPPGASTVWSRSRGRCLTSCSPTSPGASRSSSSPVRVRGTSTTTSARTTSPACRR